MTYYVCQCPHLGDARVWTAASEDDIIDLIVGDTEREFASAIEAAAYDMRDAYVTNDPFDLYVWISTTQAAGATRANRAFFASRDVCYDINATASEIESDDDMLYSAFDGQVIWSEDDSEWRLGNEEPVEAVDMVHALCAASLVIATRDNMVHDDV